MRPVQTIAARIFTLVLGMIGVGSAYAQDHSVARAWIEATLHAIRNDFARPTIHARNLHHVTIGMYDTWSLFDENAETYLIGKQIDAFHSEFELPISFSSEQRDEIISHTAYRLLTFRFQNSPNQEVTQHYFDSLMNHYGLSTSNTSLDYQGGSASSLGNFLASEIIRFGLMDGSNEQGSFENLYYEPINSSLLLTEDSIISLVDPDRWQPLTFETFIDQGGNVVAGNTPTFLSPEWGNVTPFSLRQENATVYTRDGHDYKVYHDPGIPSMLGNDQHEEYAWGFALVSHWGSHLDPSDGVLWDISPNTVGNSADYPTNFQDYKSFYLPDGGTLQSGYDQNPITGVLYDEQLVPRGDYARVLAEFWADGPDSETPPGHWFTILNYVMDHPLFEYKYQGNQEMEKLEYEIKAYFILGAAMHDAAITAWSIKGWYDYIRPVSAIRYMASLGQSTNLSLPNYHEHGIPLIDGLVEVVSEGDPLASEEESIGQIKLYSWRGHPFINDPTTDVAGTGWILAKNWWPYQRPSFVTPPFAGYISGHSTFSSAAAEIITLMTGSPYFPGGLGAFYAPKDEFLVFEKGPSVDITLQWVTYKDAADQCSLSRIWGGIHPPVDDIPGRIIGPLVAKEVFDLADKYFSGQTILSTPTTSKGEVWVYPNPVITGNSITIHSHEESFYCLEVFDLNGKKHLELKVKGNQIPINLNEGTYLIRLTGKDSNTVVRFRVQSK